MQKNENGGSEALEEAVGMQINDRFQLRTGSKLFDRLEMAFWFLLSMLACFSDICTMQKNDGKIHIDTAGPLRQQEENKRKIKWLSFTKKDKSQGVNTSNMLKHRSMLCVVYATLSDCLSR